MMILSRTVRLTVRPPRSGSVHAAPAAAAASLLSGVAASDAIGAYFEITVSVAGMPDPVSGYVIPIGAIDSAVRETVAPLVERALWPGPGSIPAAQMLSLPRVAADAVAARLNRPVDSLTLHLNPFDRISWSPAMPARVLLSAQIECAAAHRLHAPSLDDAANRALFGKCNNPNGHGHNYRIEATVSMPADGADGALGLPALARILDEHVTRRIDHRHLNLDVPEFAQRIPSVEHIASACVDWLREPVRRAGGALVRVSVWETEKTCATVEA